MPYHHFIRDHSGWHTHQREVLFANPHLEVHRVTVDFADAARAVYLDGHASKRCGGRGAAHDRGKVRAGSSGTGAHSGDDLGVSRGANRRPGRAGSDPGDRAAGTGGRSWLRARARRRSDFVGSLFSECRFYGRTQPSVAHFPGEDARRLARRTIRPKRLPNAKPSPKASSAG